MRPRPKKSKPTDAASRTKLSMRGCGTTGTTAKVDALTSELQKSIAEYRACVDANGKRVKACEAQRLAMEAEERAYFNRSSGTQGGTSASNVNIQSR